MNRELETGKDELVMDMGDDSDLRMGAGPSGSGRRQSKWSMRGWGWAVGGAVLVFLVGFFLGSGFGGGSGPGTSEDLGPLSARVASLEDAVRRLDPMEDRIVNLERMGTGMRQSMDSWQDAEKSLSKRLHTLAEDVKRLERKAVVYVPEAKAPSTAAAKPEPEKKARYHKVSPGDTLYRISIKYGITVDELCRLNNITPKQVIKDGQMLLISRGG